MQATGGSSYDDTLRTMMVPFANDTLAEVDREQRWSLAYGEPFVTTVQGTQNYTISAPAPTASGGMTSNLAIKAVFWLDVNGRRNEVRRYDKSELQRTYSDPTSASPNQGRPKYFSMEPTTSQAGTENFGAPAMQIILYPTPDNQGPETGGNYKIHIGGYYATPPIIETTATIAGPPTTTLTVLSGPFLTANLLPVDGTGYGLTVSIPAAGYPQISAGNVDDHVTSWTNIAANVVTLSLPAQTAVSNAQTFFNSSNWIISYWPKVLLFGMLREVANYYGDTQHYPIWEARFQEQLERMRKYDFDRSRGFDQEALAVTGQLASSLRRLDGFATIDVRGGA